jgi:hypothetical protein
MQTGGLVLPEQIHFLPKIRFEPVAQISTLQKAIERFGAQRIRNALLWAALSGRKDMTLSGSLFPRTITEKPENDANVSHEEFRLRLLKP